VITARYLGWSFVSGAVWAVIAWALWPPRHSAPSVWGAMLASPVIGLIIGLGFWWIHDLPKAARIFVSLVSLYASAVLFGIAVGMTDLAARRITGSIPSAVVLEAIAAVLWGLTFTGYVIVLWPLAYWNHEWLGRLTLPREG
jgi:hypothetical protein